MSVEPVSEVEDHLQAVDSYKLEQYKESKVLNTLSHALITQLQEIEDNFLDLQYGLL